MGPPRFTGDRQRPPGSGRQETQVAPGGGEAEAPTTQDWTRVPRFLISRVRNRDEGEGKRLPRGSDESLSISGQHGLELGMDIQLEENILNVIANCIHGYTKLVCDRVIGHSISHEA